jgi:hypothetical protein
VQHSHRTAPPVDKLAPSAELIAGVAPAADLIADPSAHQAFAALTPADLPPSIPHRILHCSWII